MAAEPAKSAPARSGGRHPVGRVRRQLAELMNTRDQMGQLLRAVVAAGAARGRAQADQEFRGMVEDSPVAICVHADGRFLYVNDTMVQKMAAESADRLLGHRIVDFVAPQSVPTVLGQIAARRRDGDISPPMEMVILPLDGTTRAVEAVAVRAQWRGRPAHQVAFWDVTEHKTAEANLRYQAALVTHVSDAIVATTLTGAVTAWNPAAEAIYGRSAVQALGRPVGEAVGAALDPAAIIAAGGVVHATHRAADGSPLAVRVSASRMDTGYVVVCADQTALRRAEQHFQTVVASLEEGVVVISSEGIVESVNPAALQIMGVPTTEAEPVEMAAVVPIPIYDSDGGLLIADQRPVLESLKISPRGSQVYGVDRFDNGRRVWLSVTWSLLDPEDPDGSSVLVSFADVTAQHTKYQRLVHQATHDHVTGLPNRAHILDLVTDALEARDHRLGAVLFIDLDKFKRVNDELGHHAGDAVLRIAAERLSAALRPDDVVGRVGGDEFVALLAAPIEPEEADVVADRLQAALGEPIVVRGDGDGLRDVKCVSASIGVVAVRPDERRSAAEILHDADLAMYRAKARGRASSHFTLGAVDLHGPAGSCSA
ncbi:bifunctional diguanylate cyclase/phosphodiesterase [Mycobacterium servetii]|uniref:Diguanylate cyclase n=1 Tax=Mycobacterium servetii TaxID=3237418 RepID=A0ABV4CA11_9MYCO